MNAQTGITERRPRAQTAPTSSFAHAIGVALQRPPEDSTTLGIDSASLCEFLSAFLFPFNTATSSSSCRVSTPIVENQASANASASSEADQGLPGSSSTTAAAKELESGAGNFASANSPPTSNSARWRLADTARARMQTYTREDAHHEESSQATPSPSTLPNPYVAAQDTVQIQFFSRKYTETVERIDKLVAEHNREKERWEIARTDLTTEKYELATKLRIVEQQLRLVQDKTRGDIERCTEAEQALHETRLERDAMRVAMDDLRATITSLRMNVRNLTTRNKELQGQIDLLQGSSSIPFPSLSSLEDLQKKNVALDEDNTRLTNELGRRAREFSMKHKELASERDAALKDAAALRERIAELEKTLAAVGCVT